MFRKLHLTFASLLLATVAFIATPAHADTVSLVLSSPAQYAGGSSTLSFYGTVTAAAGNTGVVNLVADNFQVDGPLTLNDDGFYFGFPTFLNAGDSFTGLLFTVYIPPTAPLGAYSGSFSILGGADGAQDDIADAGFTVGVTPEPSSIVFLATGLSGVIATVRRKRSIRS